MAIALAGLAATLVACTVGDSHHVQTSGAAGNAQTMTSGSGGDVALPPAGDSGAAGAAGASIFPTTSGAAGIVGVSGSSGTTCNTGVAGTAGRLMSPFSPQIPTTVTHASTPVPPLTGGTLLALSDNVTVVASDPDGDVVYVVDLPSSSVRSTVALMAGDEPGRLAEDGAGRVHVALRRGGAVVTIDPTAGKVTARRAVCAAPRGIAYEATTGLLHVACTSGELVSLPPVGDTVARKVVLGDDLRDVVVGKGGSLLVSTFRKAEVLVVGASGAVTTRLQPGSGMLPTLMGMQQTRTPSVAWRMASVGDASGTVVMLHQTGTPDTIDPSGGGYAGLKGCGGIVQAGVSQLSQDQTSPPAVATGLSEVSLAIDVAVSPDGSKMAVAVPGNAGVTGGLPTLVEGSTSTMTANNPSPCGVGAPGVSNPPTGQVVAVSYGGPNAGVLFAQTREPAAIWRGDTATAILLPAGAHTDTGHLIFHVNAGGGLACASCHPEGGEDGRVWNFACAGARRTQSIRGDISPTAPFHWDGSETSFGRLMDDVFSGRMAGPSLSDDQKTALESWVDTIPELPAVAGLDASAVARGKALFTDANVGCATCHAGTLLTNNATVDVGTGGMFQVPSLRGVAWRAPFMHTGCAATLADRFGATCGGGDKHGVTSTLTPAQVNDLTTYLKSL